MPAITDTNAIKGLAKWKAQIAALAKFDEVEALSAGAKVIVDYMKPITPVDTGELRDSEEVVVNGKQVGIKAGADHASYVEFGTYKMKAQPYFRPAIHATRRTAAKAVGDNLVAQFKRLIRRA